MKRIVVLKVGGSLGADAGASLVAAIRHVQAEGGQPVVVHGGGPRITQALAAVSAELPFVNGQRVTPPHLMPIVERVLCAEVNGELVSFLSSEGFACESLTSQHGVLFATPLAEMGRTGVVTKVNTGPLTRVLIEHKVPVVAPVAVEAVSGLACNVNADLAASAIAGALAAERIVFFTDVDGIFANFATRELISFATDEFLEQHLADGLFTGGMLPKVTAVLESLRAGVEAAFVIHGGKPLAAKSAVSRTDGRHFGGNQIGGPDLAHQADSKLGHVLEGSAVEQGTCVVAAARQWLRVNGN